MNRIRPILISLLCLSFLISGVNTLKAAEKSISPNSEFRRIEQPLSLKIGITLGGIVLIGAEVWWFLLKPRKIQQATAKAGVQELTITVNGGYQPDYVVVNAGQLVRLSFLRQDANSCLSEILLPDFGIHTALPLNQITTVEFTPQQPGEYTFTCGMRMFRGMISVQSVEQPQTA